MSDEIILVKGALDAREEGTRQEREAVRGAEGEGDVEGASRTNRELSGRIEPRRQEVSFVLVSIVVVTGGTTAQKKAAGRKGGKATARKS